MGSVHLPRLNGRGGRPRMGRMRRIGIAAAVLAAMAVAGGVHSAASAATDAPYGGTAAAVPGTVYAANYDTGGQGVAYNVTSTNGSANGYRTDGIDLETTADTQSNTGAGAYDMGWTTAGQWFNYTVNVATAGSYTVAFRVSSPYGIADAAHIDNSSGTNLSGSVTIPNTGGYETWATVDATVTLPAGQQTLKVDQDSNGWNFHLMTFTLTSGGGGTPPRRRPGDQPFGGTPATVPGTVQAANYDTGGQGVAYNVTAANGSANSYRSDGVDLETTADTQDTSAPGGTYDIGWTNPGQWFKYTVNVATAGTYTVSFRVASPYGITDALHITNSSNTNLTGSVAVPNTGGYETWATVTATVTLGRRADADGRPGLQRLQLPLHGLRDGIGGTPPPPHRPPAAAAPTAARPTSRWISRPPPPRSRPAATTCPTTRPTATPAPAGQARPATRSGSRSTSGPRRRSAAWASSGRPRTPRRSQIQVSNDNSTWSTVYSTTTGTGGQETFPISTTARYIRVYATVRATTFGDSIFEFDVYGPTNTPPLTGGNGNGGNGSCAWVGSTAPVATRVQQVLNTMDQSEEASLLSGDGTSSYIGQVNAIPDLCIPSINMEDGPSGVGDGNGGVTAFPDGENAAATFDPTLVQQEGAAKGAEFAGKGATVSLGPTTNLVRDPRWGRTYETYGEDPYLAGQITSAEVEGLQSQDVMAMVKHVAAYDQEQYPNGTNNETVGQQALEELYLAPSRPPSSSPPRPP